MTVTPIIPVQIEEVGNGATPMGSGSHPSDRTPSGSAGYAVSILRAELLAKAEEQVRYWRERQSHETSPEDTLDDDGNYTPMGDDAAMRFGSCNGRYSEADWWLKTIQALDLSAFAAANPSGWSELVADAERFRALMRCGRIKMQGSAGVNALTGGRTYPDQPGMVHFGAEFWVQPEDEPSPFTIWGRHCLRALADDILALEAAPCDEPPKGEDAPSAAEGRSPASAVPEGQAPIPSPHPDPVGEAKALLEVAKR